LERIVPLLNWVEHSALAIAIAQSNWAFPAIETIHVLALTLTIGTVLIVDLRLLGLASAKQPYEVLRREVLPWTWAAFCVAVISGSLMFISQATEYYANSAFRAKFVLLLLAGLNILVFELIIARDAANWDRAIPWPAKPAALLSIALWIQSSFLAGALALR
jgi:uncharacterized membrane protein